MRRQKFELFFSVEKEKNNQKKEGVAGKWINNRIWFNNGYDIMFIELRKVFVSYFLDFWIRPKTKSRCCRPTFWRRFEDFYRRYLNLGTYTYSNEFILGFGNKGFSIIMSGNMISSPWRLNFTNEITEYIMSSKPK